jgi:hypothetical protein
MSAGLPINELRVDANLVLVALDRAFEHITHAKFFADHFGIDILALEAEGRVAGNDKAVAGA